MEKDINLKVRSQVLEMALGIEQLINDSLKSFLGIDDEVITKTLNYKSSSISFKTKIHLLLDLGKISKTEFDCFDKFMEIRNQFMHNINVCSFCEVVDHLNGIEGWLIKNIELDEETHQTLKKLNSEKQREAHIHFLFATLNSNIADIMYTMIEKNNKENKKDYLYLIGYKYCETIVKNLHPSLKSIYKEQLEILNKGSKKEFTISDIEFLFKLSQDMLNRRLNAYLDQKFPKDSKDRIDFEQEFNIKNIDFLSHEELTN
jgi:hypothetical protein